MADRLTAAKSLAVFCTSLSKTAEEGGEYNAATGLQMMAEAFSNVTDKEQLKVAWNCHRMIRDAQLAHANDIPLEVVTSVHATLVAAALVDDTPSAAQGNVWKLLKKC